MAKKRQAGQLTEPRIETSEAEASVKKVESKPDKPVSVQQPKPKKESTKKATRPSIRTVPIEPPTANPLTEAAHRARSDAIIDFLGEQEIHSLLRPFRMCLRGRNLGSWHDFSPTIQSYIREKLVREAKDVRRLVKTVGALIDLWPTLSPERANKILSIWWGMEAIDELSKVGRRKVSRA